MVTIVIGSVIWIERLTAWDISRLQQEPARLMLDQRGKLLRWFPDKNGERHIFRPLDHYPDHVKNAFIAAEDQRFFEHSGVDIPSIVRAVKDNLTEGRIVSGASTITQQLTRMTHPRGRSYIHKFLEAIRAIRLEGEMSKDQILELYLNRVPMGNNLVGIEAASQVYFGKTSRHLTLPEAAVLAALPKAPGFMNPYGKHRDRLLIRKDWVLERMHELGFINKEDLVTSQPGIIHFKPRDIPFEAPHYINFLMSRNPLKVSKVTTLNLDLQKRITKIVGGHRQRLDKHQAHQAAVLVMENKTSHVLAMVGSLKYTRVNQGFNNGALALRSPGSALKPFLYAQAVDSGFKSSDILEDVHQSYAAPQGLYRPLNFDRVVYGPVSMKEALGNSLNQSAVHLLNRVGHKAFYKTLQSLDLINHPHNGPDHYGLGLILGNPEVSLLQLVTAYSTLANNGVYRRPVFYPAQEREKGRRVFSPEASFIITDMLSDPGARNLTFGDFFDQTLPFKMAVKTGTSTHYRDAWIIGYTPRYTVGVWVGNFDGRPTHKMTGASAGGPILAEIMRVLHPDSNPGPFFKPPGVAQAPICSFSGMRPGNFCPHIKNQLFLVGKEPRNNCSFHLSRESIHYLAAPFAGWLYEQHRENAAGRFRLAGFDSDLASTFARKPDGRPENPLSGRSGKVRITYPVEGDHFVKGRDGGHSKIDLTARTEKPIPVVHWFIDGMEYGEVGPPYEIPWNLTPGRHEITAVGPSGRGESVSIFVE